MVTVKIVKDLLAANAEIALKNRELFKTKHILVINLMSSPGSGNTSLLEATVKAIGNQYRIGVIEGDIEGIADAERLEKLHIPVVQLNTKGACHIDAPMVERGLEELPLDDIDILFIENVGNLVCPAEFDCGEDYKVLVFSVTEGDDKPLKYPLMFHESTAMVINKTDLLPYLDSSLETIKRNSLKSNPKLKIFEVSTKNNYNLDSWLRWLITKLTDKRGRV
jgi:hydrogenase nickel incorporation protein HypB